jgi:hypothetical protein
MIIILFGKFDKTFLENELNDLFSNKIKIDYYQKILDEKIKIS